MDEAERCSQVGLMYGGQLVEQGTPAEIKALIPGELLEFRPVSDQLRGVGLLRTARRALAEQEGVLEIQTYGDLMHVFVDDLRQRQSQIEAALNAKQIRPENLRQTTPRMEEAFISIIGRMETGTHHE
jgi:ABC-2 type transport system ATP-binding protein